MPLAAALVLLAGCVTTGVLTAAGQAVRLSRIEPTECQPLGVVGGVSDEFSPYDIESRMTSAQNDMRNRAGYKGANYAVMDTAQSSYGQYYLTGRAFHCDAMPGEGRGATASVQPSPSSPPPPPPEPPPATAEQRLAKLKSLLEKGLITQEDYERRKAEILQSL